jgi:FkbM family methyltransferase
MTYYSQDNQDYNLEKYVFKGLKNGFFIDVGAHDGITFNNTLYFEKIHNWNGINIEPIKNIFNKLCINRPNCININVAIDDIEGESEFCENIGYTEMLSGLQKHYDARHLERIKMEKHIDDKTNIIMVKTKTLNNIITEHNIKRINYLSVDVEGAEFNVINTINFDEVYIDVIGFENNYPNNSQKIIEFLNNKGYYTIFKSLDIFMIHNNSEFIKNF